MVAPCVAVLALLLTGLPLKVQAGAAQRGTAAVAAAAPGACEAYRLRQPGELRPPLTTVPKRLSHAAPAFPPLPPGTRVTTRPIRAELLVSRDGTVTRVWVLESPTFDPPLPEFRAAVVKALRAYRYQPSARASCLPVTMLFNWS